MGTQIALSSCTELRSNPGFYLRSDAQKAWDRSCAAFGKIVIITGAWRSYETQEKLFDGEKFPNQAPQYGRYLRGNRSGQRGFTNDVRWWPAKNSYWTRKDGTAAAAVPGTSNHGGGISVDAKTRREKGDPSYDTHVIFAGWNDVDRTRFLRVAAEHGWADDEGEQVGEHWHLTYYPDRDKHRGEAVPTPPEKEEPDMDKAQDARLKKIEDLAETIKGLVDAQVLEGPYEPVSKRKWVSVTRALRLIRLNGIETRSRVQDMQAQLRGLRSLVETMAKNQNLDPERVYALLDENLKEAFRDLRITSEPDDEETQP